MKLVIPLTTFSALTASVVADDSFFLLDQDEAPQSINTVAAANQYCEDMGGTLATQEEACDYFTENPASGDDTWLPVLGGNWIEIGAENDNYCQAHDLVCAPTGAPVNSPTASPVEDPTTFPVEDPTTSPVDSPTASPVEDPTASPIASPTASPVEDPTTSPVEDPTTSPVDSPTASPVEDPTTSPVDSPTASPVEDPTASPIASPTASPVEDPTASPIASPTASPVEDPTASPVAAPASLQGGCRRPEYCKPYETRIAGCDIVEGCPELVPNAYYPDPENCAGYCFSTGTAAPCRYEVVDLTADVVMDAYGTRFGASPAYSDIPANGRSAACSGNRGNPLDGTCGMLTSTRSSTWTYLGVAVPNLEHCKYWPDRDGGASGNLGNPTLPPPTNSYRRRLGMKSRPTKSFHRSLNDDQCEIDPRFVLCKGGEPTASPVASTASPTEEVDDLLCHE